jgi:hypothetical protein
MLLLARGPWPLCSSALLFLAAAMAGGCDGGRLERMDRSLSAELVELHAIANNREQFRRELAKLLEKHAALVGLFDRATADLEATGHAAGFQVEERVASHPEMGWATARIRFRRDGPTSDAMKALQALDVGEGAWLEAVRCTTTGCTMILSAAKPSPDAAEASPELALPVRPCWPPSAKRWDRVREQMDERARLRASLGEVSGTRTLMRRMQALIEVLEVIQSEDFRTGELLRAVDAAHSAGVRAFEARRVPSGVQLVAPEAPPALEAALRTQGGLVREGSTYTVQLDSPHVLPRGVMPPSDFGHEGFGQEQK